MKQLSKQRQNRILKLTPDWMDGKITIYQVAKASKTDWHTTKTYLHVYAKAIRNQEVEIVKKLTVIDESKEELSVWERIKKRIWSSLLTEPRTMQPPK